MDKKRASDILGLGPGATRTAAKQAFRTLAKSCHPDRFARDPGGAKTAEARMKEINGAFSFLYPLLPRRPTPIRPGEAGQRPGFFSLIRKKWRARPGTRTGTGPAVTKKRGPGVVRPPEGREEKKPCFDRVLAGVDPGQVPPEGKRSKPINPYENYCRHISVKKKIKGARTRTENTGIARVERISPIRRVHSVGGK